MDPYPRQSHGALNHRGTPPTPPGTALTPAPVRTAAPRTGFLARGASIKPTLQAVTRGREQRRLDQDTSLRKKTRALVRSVTGTEVSDEWAGKILRHVLDGKEPGDPWHYVKGAITTSGDPRTEFLPHSLPGYRKEG